MYPPPPLEKTKFWRCFTWTLGTHIHVCGLCTALSMHTCGCFVCQACVCVICQSSFSAMRSSLLHLPVSLPSLSIPFCVKTINIQELAPLEMPSFTLSLFLSSCLRTLPIWNPACDSSTRRGKRWSRLRAPCPQSRLLSQDLAGWSWGTAHSRRQCRTSWKLGMWSAWSSHFCPLQVLRLRGNSSWLIPWWHGSSIL